MSGGHFDHGQYHISNIADSIESIIHKNNIDEVDQWGYSTGYNFSEETIAEFKIAIKKLNEAYVYAQRIDWLISGDDGEETFHKRLKNDLDRVKQ